MKDDDKKKSKRYPLGGEFGDKYLTYQEARCMACFLRGNTVKSAARIMDLSPRTVEYYVNNMKKRLDCHTKSELIYRVIETEFPYKFNLNPMEF